MDISNINFEQYNYLDAVKNDVKDAIESGDYRSVSEFRNLDEYKEYLNDELWMDDSVTGNASGSYAKNRLQAGLNLVGNHSLLDEVALDFGEIKNFDEESLDVSIRCYLLGQAIDEVIDEMDLSEDYEEKRSTKKTSKIAEVKKNTK